MNSPVPCLPDPIQNMAGKKNLRVQKKKKNVIIRAPRQSSAATMQTAPASYSAIMGRKSDMPIMAGQGGTLIVQNFELVHSQSGNSGNFAVGGDVCNPGLGTNFPWLANIAQNYSKFRWRALRYLYVPACSTTTAGSTFLMFTYDPQDSGPSTLIDVSNNQESSTGNVWFGGAINSEVAFRRNISAQEAVCVDLDTSRLSNPWYYVRRSQGTVSVNTGGALTGAPTGGIGTLAFTQGSFADPSSRPATIYYGTTGAGTATNGYIYVAYVCEFSEPTASADNL